MFEFGSKPTKNLRLKGGLVIGSDKNKLIQHILGMEYQNECTNIDMTVEQTKYRTGDLKKHHLDSFLRLKIWDKK